MIDLLPACHQLAELLSAVPDHRLDSPTPCGEYTVDDLIAHIDEVSAGFAALARPGLTPQDGEHDGPATPESPENRRNRVISQVQSLGAAWDDPVAWTGSSEGAGVSLPNEVWGKVALTEMVVHAWDLAQAVGMPLALPEDTLRACRDHVAEFVPNAPVPELWGPSVDVAAGAPLIDQVVAITGRTP